MREKIYPTLIELWIGNTIWSMVAALIGVWFCKDKTAWLLGMLFGLLASYALAYYMAQSIRLLVDDLDAGLGDKRIRSSSMIRLGISGAVIAIACVVPFLNPIGTFLGILSTKFSSYSNPLIHKVTPKISPFFKDKEYPGEETTDAETTAEPEGNQTELTDGTKPSEK